MCLKVPKLLSRICLQCIILVNFGVVAIQFESVQRSFDGKSFVQCLKSAEKLKCFEQQIVRRLDNAIQDNSTWRYGDFMFIEKKPTSSFTRERGNDSYVQLLRTARAQRDAETMTSQRISSRSFGDAIGEKLLQLAESRMVRLQLPRPQSSMHLMNLGSGISDALDAFGNGMTNELAAAEEGTKSKDKIKIKKKFKKKLKKKKKNCYSYLTNPLKGRKKKDKDKNMATIGGMAMMAMVAQMFLGKVILIAGAAFIMAKIALVIALLGSLKKGSSGSSGSTEHVIVTGGGGGGGHSHDSGWHRSMPYDEHIVQLHEYNAKPEPEHIQVVEVEAEHHPHSHSHKHGSGSGGHKSNYYHYEMPEGDDEHDFKRRQANGFL